jgi:hypothetical protein
MRVVKGIFVIREWPVVAVVKSEMTKILRRETWFELPWAVIVDKNAPCNDN